MPWATSNSARCRCANQFLAKRSRVAVELANRAHVASAIAERHRLAQLQAEAMQRAEAERVSWLAQGVAAVRAAVSADQLDKAARLLAPLAREFAQDQEVQGLADAIP